jgi:hypothetical protein
VRRWVLVGLVNLLLRQLYRHAAGPQGPFGSVFIEYYRHNEFQVAHFLPECARYDPELTYTMRSGQCTFSGREFSTTLRFNSAGLRDDEQSLIGPRIIVLGDSHSMGWGVEYDEAWPRILERDLGEPVLNAAVPSYATVRELRDLARLDLDALELLIIQYSDNDFLENASFAAQGDSFRVMSEEDYRRDQLFHSQLPRPYRFGQFVYEAQKLATNAPIKALKRLIDPPLVPTAPQEAATFLHALRHAPVPLDDVQILMFEFPGHARERERRRAFIEALRTQKNAADEPAYVRRMILLDLSDALATEHYFSWDPHARPEGQAIIADRVLDGLRENGLAERASLEGRPDGFPGGRTTIWPRACSSAGRVGA